ncbi:UPF0481 protein [Camellia lanceoleosa]|uniref:UPF0481 protein n=1 Tax=Camellia lanceoleosa TaxID=1840588 RepID=A0ACC0G7C3_9ERIC|nr:UPF0481 protein [Camellia lanceoleosa]
MENGEHQVITIAESDSNQELPVRSTNEIEESTDVASTIHMQGRLNEIRREGIQNLRERQNGFICKVPRSLTEIGSPRDIEPEIVSISPYHRGKDGVLEFESFKRQFLDSLLSRKHQLQAVHLRLAMKELERQARTWYSEPIEISSEQFIEMMMLDGCFIIELFQQVSESEDSVNADSLLFRKTWLIPILIRDLLKLENQLPFFVLERLFNLSTGNTSDLLSLQALKFFNRALPSPQGSSTYFSEYIAFMSCLINSGRDVTFLCDNGIITNFSYNYRQVAHLFRKLGEKVVFNIRKCYLSKQFREVETYYSSNWATLRRTYFSNPWSSISVVSASVLLAMTTIQTIMAILSYKVHHS